MWRPYELGYANGTICVRGSVDELNTLLTMPRAKLQGRLNDPESYVYFPASRLGFIIAEALGAPTRITEKYKAARKQSFETPLRKYATRLVALKRIFKAPLSQHQLEAVAVALETDRLFNGSEQGTGKTRTSIATLTAWGIERGVIVTQKNIIDEWVKEFGRCLPAGTYDLTPLIDMPVRDRQNKIRELIIKDSGVPHFILTNYEVLKALEPLISRWQPEAVVYDESYMIKNPRAKVSKSAHILSRNAEYRTILMTGTPIGNHAGDLFSQLECLTQTHLNIYQWEVLYTIQKQFEVNGRRFTKAIGTQNLPGLMERLVDVGWYRATKASSLDLPPKQHERVWLELNNVQRLLYDDLSKRGEQALGNALALTDDRVVMLRHQQLVGGWIETWDAGHGIDDEGDPLPPMLMPTAKTLNFFGSPKYDWVKQWAIDNLLGDTSTRAIIWCKFNTEVRGLTGMLQEVLGENRVASITAHTKDSVMSEIKSSFNSRSADGVQVIVAQIKKLAYGHNLQAGDWNIYYSHTWSLPEKLQSEDRTHRQGREGVVRYVELCCRKTIDEDIMRAMERKQSFFEQFAQDTVSG